MRAHADEPLAQFLDYCTYGYMIDNVVLIVTGTLHERDVRELLDKCHPLGAFDNMATGAWHDALPRAEGAPSTSRDGAPGAA